MGCTRAMLVDSLLFKFVFLEVFLFAPLIKNPFISFSLCRVEIGTFDGSGFLELSLISFCSFKHLSALSCNVFGNRLTSLISSEVKCLSIISFPSIPSTQSVLCST